MADTGKVPLDLQLVTSVPLGIRAYRRRFQSPCTNLQTAKPDDYVNIYPDTSTPGSFIDPESTYLSFDLEIQNKHAMVDFTDFGVEGAGGAIIQDWRVFNQGSILEEILEYGTVASALSNIEGAYQYEQSMYFSSRLRNGFQEEHHRNFIKPPMVDSSGNIMYGLNLMGLPNNLGIATSLYANAFVDGGGSTSGNGYAQNQLICSSAMSVKNMKAEVAGSLTIAAYDSVVSNNTDTVASSFDFINTLQQNSLPSWSTVTTLNIPLTANSITPADFPDLFSPQMVDIIRPYVQEFGSINKPQIMANLCNVKCFPIGQIPSRNAFNDASYGTISPAAYLGTQPAGSTAGSFTAPVTQPITYRICYRPYSGIFGKMATKMLATTLLSPQQMYINLHLAQASIFFNVSADPCRRIVGTLRDYVRNLGYANGRPMTATYTGATTGNNTSIYNYVASNFAPGYGPYHCIPTAVGLTGIQSSSSAIFTAAAASGRSLLSANGFGTESLGVTVLPPTPQYMLSVDPNLYKFPVNGTVQNYANESQCFYGTYLTASVPQTARIFDFTSTGSSGGNIVPSSGTITNSDLITYSISNINLVGDQIILPNETTADIIMQAEAGNFNVHTNSVRTYVLSVQNGETQSIICPLKVNMAKRVLFIFQNNRQRNGNQGYLYDSNCGINPFASIYAPSDATFVTNATGFLGSAGTAATIYGVGFTKQLTYNPVYTKPTDANLSLQLRIGNDFYPPQPLTTMQEISAELVKTLEGWQTSFFSPTVDASTLIYGTKATDQKLAYNCLEPSKFTTAFIPTNLLDDQTITCNTDMVPLFARIAGGLATASGDIANSTSAVATSNTNGYNYLSPRGFCIQGLFKSPSSRFILGFNMRSFKASDGCDGGTYLGNNTITLQMTGCKGLAVPGEGYRGVAIVPHRCVMRYSPGGQLIWAY